MKIAIYTAIYGDYDTLKPPLNRGTENLVDYFIFTDQDLKTEGFTTVINSKYKKKSNSLKARYAKIKAHDHLLDYDYLVWFDASFQIDEKEIIELINNNANKDLFLFKHPNRICVYKEITACYFAYKEKPIKLFLQNIFYKIKGLKKNSGLYATGIFIRKCKPKVNKLFDHWFKHVLYLSLRDQISLTYALKKNPVNFLILDADIYSSALGTFYGHEKSIYKTNRGFFRRAFFKIKMILKRSK